MQSALRELRMTIGALTSFALLVLVASSAQNNPVRDLQPGIGRVPRAQSLRAAPKFELAGRGCCSWHGGECGCSGGRVVCCDGTFSPTCTCHAHVEDAFAAKDCSRWNLPASFRSASVLMMQSPKRYLTLDTAPVLHGHE
jgi:hypothetical protein